MISKESIQEVKDAAQIVELISGYVNLKRNGRNFKGLCPFHNEKTPSFIVSPDKNIYKCFGCQRAGDSVSFVMEAEGASYIEAIRTIAKRFGIQLEENTREADESYLEKQSLFIVNEFAKDYYKELLYSTGKGKSIGLGYFKQRGFLEETLRTFSLGFTYDLKDGLVDTAIKGGFEKEKLEEAGLLNQYGQDFFRNRVIFPIQNASGKVVGFAGRILEEDKKAAKYLNTRETEIYNKRKVLYGMFQAKQAIRRADQCILVEGYTDVMSLHQNEVKNVVAASGTSLTTDQCRLIKRFTNNVLLIFDGDTAGLKAALRGMDVLLSEELNVEVVGLPQGDDPDSLMVRLGSTQFQDFLKLNAKDFVIYKSEHLMQNATNPVQKIAAYKDLASTLAQIPNALRRSVYTKECAEILKIEEHHLVNETNKFLKSKTKVERVRQKKQDIELKERKKATQIKASSDQDIPQERELASILIKYGMKVYKEGTIAGFIMEQFAEELDHFDCVLTKKIMSEYFTLVTEEVDMNDNHFTTHIEIEIKSFAVSLYTQPYEYSENWEKKLENPMQNQKMPDEKETYEKELMETVLRLKMRKINKQIAQNIKDMQEITLDDQESLVKLIMQKHLIESRNHLASKLNQVVFK